MKAQRTGLATRLITAQIVVILAGATTLFVAAALSAPIIFSDHLSQAHVTDPAVLVHAEDAFNSAFWLSLVIGTAASLAAAGLMSWLLVRRVAPPLQRLAQAAESVANGNYDVQVLDEGFGTELQTVSQSFRRMSDRLGAIDASRTRMLDDLAHEIRTPLATLEVFVDGMEDDVVPIDEQTYAVLHSQIARLQRLASDVRDAANAEEHALSIHPRTLQLRRQLEMAVELARPQFLAEEVALDDSDSVAVTTVDADEQRLQQVLTILLSNALRHTPRGGHVVLSAGNDGDFVTIAVTDDGEGISADQLDAIFERFYRGDPSRATTDAPGGSGLGLTIARAIATEHGGTLTATSPGPGRGATFTVRLPKRSPDLA